MEGAKEYIGVVNDGDGGGASAHITEDDCASIFGEFLRRGLVIAIVKSNRGILADKHGIA